MTWATYQQFTFFVLLVCIVLSFVLRQLIREVQELRQLMHKDLHQFAEKLVRENPSIENYLQLGSLYFRNRDYISAHRYFEKLLSERVYAKEAGYYMTLCLIEEGQRQEAWAMYQRLDQSRYTDLEKRRLLVALRTPRFFGILRNFFLKILLTQVSLKYPLLGETYTSAREQKIAKLMASMPTRYQKMEWISEGDKDWDLQALDWHLERKVLLRVAKSGQSDLEIEKFFEHPRILAQLHSRAFPQVYDLQQGELCFYSLELPFGIDLLQKIAESSADNRPDDLLRCFLSLCRPLLHIKTGGFWLSEFEPSAILWHSQRDSFCFHARLESFDKYKATEIMKAIVELFQRQLTDRPHLKNRAQMAKIELCDLEDFVHNLQACLEDCLLERTQDRQSLLEELLELEVLHRASVHGLKGKFGIFRRYGTDSNRLLETFFRPQNVEDVVQKLESMSQLIMQLSQRRSNRSFPVLDEVLSLDVDSIISRIRKLALEWSPSRQDSQFVEFLKLQHQLFEKISDSLGQFLHRHSLSLDLFLQQFIDKFVEKDRLHLLGTSAAMSTKLALVSPDEMIRDLLIILENLCHNALEAGANSIEILVVRSEASWVTLEVCDNGPGFSEAVLSEMNSRDGVRIISGGTGLPTSQALCESLGGKFSLQSQSGNGAKITLSLPCFIA